MKAFHHYKKLRSIGATRIRLGMSQEAFATELGISRSLLSMAETGKRTLPASALAKLAKLEIGMAIGATMRRNEQLHPAELNENYLNAYAPAILNFKELKCRRDADKKECDLAIMIATYKQVRQSLEEVEMLLNNLVDYPDDYTRAGLLSHQRYLLTKLHRNSVPAQNELNHKIALLRAAAEMHAINQASYEKK